MSPIGDNVDKAGSTVPGSQSVPAFWSSWSWSELGLMVLDIPTVNLV